MKHSLTQLHANALAKVPRFTQICVEEKIAVVAIWNGTNLQADMDRSVHTRGK